MLVFQTAASTVTDCYSLSAKDTITHTHTHSLKHTQTHTQRKAHTFCHHRAFLCGLSLTHKNTSKTQKICVCSLPLSHKTPPPPPPLGLYSSLESGVSFCCC